MLLFIAAAAAGARGGFRTRAPRRKRTPPPASRGGRGAGASSGVSASGGSAAWARPHDTKPALPGLADPNCPSASQGANAALRPLEHRERAEGCASRGRPSSNECRSMLKSVKSKLAGQDKAPRTSSNSSSSQAPPPPPSARNSSGPTSTSAAAAPASSSNRMASSQASRGTSGSAAQRPYTAPGFNAANCAAAYAETLPSFRDVSAAERQALFVKKLHLCSYTFDFTGEPRGGPEMLSEQHCGACDAPSGAHAGPDPGAVFHPFLFLLQTRRRT